MIISIFDRVENIVGKFLHFPQGFQKASFPDPSKGVVVWEGVKFRPFGKGHYRVGPWKVMIDDKQFGKLTPPRVESTPEDCLELCKVLSTWK